MGTHTLRFKILNNYLGEANLYHMNNSENQLDGRWPQKGPTKRRLSIF